MAVPNADWQLTPHPSFGHPLPTGEGLEVRGSLPLDTNLTEL